MPPPPTPSASERRRAGAASPWRAPGHAFARLRTTHATRERIEMPETLSDSEIETLRVGAMGRACWSRPATGASSTSSRRPERWRSTSHRPREVGQRARQARRAGPQHGLRRHDADRGGRVAHARGVALVRGVARGEGARRAERLSGVRARPGTVGRSRRPRRRRRRGCGDRQDRGRPRARWQAEAAAT